ncbi:hypothetical protein N7462_009274 [Penicillium macrosclerotiorum]|uniref:uncharacterized protein n=1 Tax=Penicillium macrosclerotiorum TaxID=303699 RepID=UPI002548B986|nr:uncharacterized protein N7462_009274 [Penicillium macrosclerotiorum]KAJ5673835.1 hypothetical protein N7462_009274 [Penicillium macrosclerotiorum]
MLRRRFSRESKTSKASSDHREQSKFTFPFSRKSSRSAAKPATELAVLDNYGSSLMSESRYDSDAQCITTPKRDLVNSPAHRGRRRMELSDLIERSHERTESERWAMGHGENIPEPPESAFGMRYIHTPPSSLRSARSPYHKAYESPDSHRSNSPSHGGVIVQGAIQTGHGIKMNQVNQARSLPDLNAINQMPKTSATKHLPTIRVPDALQDQSLAVDWAQFVGPNRQKYGISSGSLPNQPNDIMVTKRRQLIASGTPGTDPRPIHLGEIGIPHRLASPSASSGTGSCNPSIAELIRLSKYGAFLNASQENIPTSQRSASAHSVPELQTHSNRRDVSSYYSHQASPISTCSSPCLGSSHFGASSPGIETPPDIKQKLFNEGFAIETGPSPTNEGLSSKFREHCENELSKTPPAQMESNYNNEAGSSRKVSIGWMSGGRRVGYGYSPVPNDEEQSKLEDGHYYTQQGSDRPEISVAGSGLGNGQVVQFSGERRDSGYAAGTSTPNPEPIRVINRQTGQEAAPTTLPKARSSIRNVDKYPEPPYLRAILSGRYSQGQDPQSPRGSKQSSGSLRASEVPPMTQMEHCQVPQSSHYNSQSADNAVNRWARLSQSLNAHPRGRKEQNNGRRSVITNVVHPAAVQDVPISGDSAADIEPEFFRTGREPNPDDLAHLLRPSNSRGAKWVRRFSKRRDSRRVSNLHKQDVSQASSGPYQDCDADSLGRANSTKSTVAEDLASMYRECLQMPGSFEGSRWASRTSRVLWDLVTTDDQ